MNVSRTPAVRAAAVAAGLVLAGVVLAAAAPRFQPGSTPPLLIDDARHPRAVLSWPTKDGGTKTIDLALPWTSANERTPTGTNLEAFAAMGGTRLEVGAGHPAGAIVRVGFYKADPSRLMFEGLPDGASITLTVTGVRFHRPAAPRPETVIQHLSYMPEDLAACGLGDTALNQYNTISRTDTLGGRITENSARMGVLDGSSPGGGTVALSVEEDGSLSMTAVVPYALFRHIRDPWLRTTPGVFLEPAHFHIEYEALPAELMAESEPGQ